MENILGKIAVFMTCISIASCQFDGEDTKILATINEKYYVLKVAGYNVDDGLQIGYSIDGNSSYEIVSSDCNDIYYTKDTIMFSKIPFQGSDTFYYIIPTVLKPNRLSNDPIQIKEAVFKNNIVRFNKVNLL